MPVDPHLDGALEDGSPAQVLIQFAASAETPRGAGGGHDHAKSELFVHRRDRIVLPRRAPPAPRVTPLLVHLIIASPSAASPGASRSRRLADAFLDGVRATRPRASIAELDVFAKGHSLDLAAKGAAALHASLHRALTEDERHDLAALDLLLDPLLRCDLLVVATPVWNFGPPWRLKQWLDCVAQPGKTFRYSAQGSRGLLSCRSALLGAVGGPLDQLNALCFAQVRATLALMGAEPAGEALAAGLDVDPAQTEALVGSGVEAARELGRSVSGSIGG